MNEENKQFIYDSIIEKCMEVATHKHGCCVIQRCLDHASPEQKKALIDVIIKYSLEMVEDQYGNYVVQYVLDLKEIDPEVFNQIAARFTNSIVPLSKQKFSSNVIEKCLALKVPVFVEAFGNLMNDEKSVIELICDSFGNYVVQRYISNAPESQ